MGQLMSDIIVLCQKSIKLFENYWTKRAREISNFTRHHLITHDMDYYDDVCDYDVKTSHSSTKI